MSALDKLRISLERQRRAYERDGFPSIETRKSRIERLICMIMDNTSSLSNAMQADYYCKPTHQYLLDINAALSALRHNKKQMVRWLNQDRHWMELSAILGRGEVVCYQPKGVVAVIWAWSFPLGFLCGSISAIYAAGNRCMIRLPEEMPETSMLIQQLIGQYFDAEELIAVSGESVTEERFASLPFNHILFSGQSVAGKSVMRSASANLAPCTAVFEAKSPVIIGKNANIRKAARSIISKKMIYAGQMSDSPDYVFVSEGWLNDFIAEVERAFQASYPSIADNPYYCSIINKYHYERISSYLDDVREKGGEIWNIVRSYEPGTRLVESRKIPLTLIINPSDNMKLMQEEILGPLLAVKSYRHIDDAIEYIASHPRPLSLYCYGNDDSELERVMSKTSSGGVIINDALRGGGCRQSAINNFKSFSHSRFICR